MTPSGRKLFGDGDGNSAANSDSGNSDDDANPSGLTVVSVAGLPGVGKSTLLHGLVALSPFVDANDSSEGVRSRFTVEHLSQWWGFPTGNIGGKGGNEGNPDSDSTGTGRFAGSESAIPLGNRAGKAQLPIGCPSATIY